MKLVATLKPKAKVNLFLHVNGRLEGGYHELESLFYYPDIYDVIEVFESDKEGLEIDGEFAPALLQSAAKQNLIITVYNALKNSYQETIPNLYFKLKKNLPVSAGIGGGSGNAAAILRFINHEYNLNIDEMQLIELGKKIGADVPPSLFEESCIVSGIGEKIDLNVKIPSLNILLVNPRQEVSTQTIFSRGFSRFNKKLNNVQYTFGNTQDLVNFLLEETTNDLEESAVSICPEIIKIKNILKNKDGCLISRMTGSGGTVFGIFKNPKLMEKAKNEIKTETDYWVC